MASTVSVGSARILAIDVGATNIKFSHVDDRAVLLERVRRRRTPSPCAPEQLVDLLATRIARCDCARVAVGFAGALFDGVVVTPGNLARRGGTGTAVDRRLESQWRGFALAQRLREATGRDVRLANDAALAALGSCTGAGAELVLTLGTGLGLAVTRDGELQVVPDVGASLFAPGRTYDEAVGEGARAQDEIIWREAVAAVVTRFATQYAAESVHLAGGNARRLSPALFDAVAVAIHIHGNEVALKGGAKLFYP